MLETMPGAGHRCGSTAGPRPTTCCCQLQADQVGVPVERPEIVETTALGAAFLAGLGTGVWSSTDELRDTWSLDRRFEPTADRRARPTPAHGRWLRGGHALQGLGRVAGQ